MLSFLSGIVNGYNQASLYGEKARVARRQGTAALNNANRQAAATMRTAAMNLDIQSDRRKTMRENQTSAVGTARNRQAASGFTSQGAGHKLESITRDRFDEVIANEARSAAIAYANEWQMAESTKAQGRLQKAAYDAEAAQYNLVAKSIRRSTVLSAIGGLAAGAFGYMQGVDDAEAYNELHAQEIADGKLEARNPESIGWQRASVYGSDVFNNFLGMNIYTASMTRKQPWGSFYSIATGAAPGVQKSANSL